MERNEEMYWVLKAILFFCTFFRRKSFSASRPVEGNAMHFAKGESFWWGYKFFMNAIEEPEPGKGIEEYLNGHPPVFETPDGFVSESTVVIGAAGDIMPAPYMNAEGAAHLFDDIGDFLFGTDLACANLEAPVMIDRPVGMPGKEILKPPAMNNTEEAFDLCFRGGKGFGFLSTANNHAMDQGEEGLVSTLDFLDAKGVSHAGTARTEAEREDILVLTVGGIRIAMLAYTFSLNREKTPDGKEYMANSLRLNLPGCDIGMIERHIRIARDKKADIVIAHLHWSLEFESFPVQNVIDTGHRILEAGADIILGNHPHTLQGAERHDWTDADGREKSGLILYALGNFVSEDSPVKNSSLAGLARITLQKGVKSGRTGTHITRADFLPVYHYLLMEGKVNTGARLLPLEKLAQELEEGTCSLPVPASQKKEILRLRDLARRLMPYAFGKEAADAR